MNGPVRLTVADDPEAILAVIQAAFVEQAGKIDPPSSMNSLSGLDISKHLETEVVWGVRCGEKLVAVMFGTDQGEALYLSKLSVCPEARGSGIAGSLMDAAQAYATDLGFTCLEVIARIELVENHAMFEGLGFEKFAEGRHDGYAQTTEFHFRKTL